MNQPGINYYLNKIFPREATFLRLPSLNDCSNQDQNNNWKGDKMKRIFMILLVICTNLITAGGKGTATEKAVLAFKLKNINISMDGKLTEPVWNNKPITNFIQRDPNEGIAASEKTEVWVAYDNEHMYVAAKLYDSKPEEIDASLTRRDNYMTSDWFALYIDPYNDKKTGFFFYVNAGGSMIDGTLFNDSWDDNTWDGIWEAKTEVNANGWNVEIKIPFSQLRFNEADQMVWGINFAREIKRNNERSYYIMVPKKESGFVSRFASLDGLDGIKPKQRFELLPYIVQKAQYLVHDKNDPFYKSNQYKPTIGADFKIGIGTNLNIDATINPDFGQVEVDPAVINLSAFESYFNEKRPFFIEGADNYYFGIGGINNNWGFNFGWPELFYSRRIGRPPRGGTSDAQYTKYPGETRILGAAKLSGKLDEATTIGAVAAVTERTYATLWNDGIRNDEEIEPSTYYGVIRGKREFNDGTQSLGFMFTNVNRSFNNQSLANNLSKNAYAFGLDGWTFLDEDKEYALAGAFAGTYVNGSKEYVQSLQKQAYRYYQRPDATYSVFDPERTSLSGYYGRVMLNKQKGNFYFNSALGFVTPGFEQNDLGFQWMADRINFHTVLGYRWFEPDGIFRDKQIYVSYARSFNFEGKSINNFIWGRFGTTFTNYYDLYFGGNYNFESYNPTLTRGGPLGISPSSYYLWLNFGTDSRKKLIVNTEVNFSKNSIGAKYNLYNLSFTWKPNSQISFSIGPSYEINNALQQWVRNVSDPTAVNTYNTRYVFAEIKQNTLSASIRLNWTFTPTLSLQLFMQPFFAIGDYFDFKELAKPRTLLYNKFGSNGSTISYNENESSYTVDPDGDGPTNKFTFGNPDFNYKSIRGTAVLRWEAMPGSILYVVWSHDQSNFENPGIFDLNRDFRNLWNSEGNDIFLVKFSYWLDI